MERVEGYDFQQLMEMTKLRMKIKRMAESSKIPFPLLPCLSELFKNIDQRLEEIDLSLKEYKSGVIFPGVIGRTEDQLQKTSRSQLGQNHCEPKRTLLTYCSVCWLTPNLYNFGAMAALSKLQIKNTKDINQTDMRQIFMKKKLNLF